MIDVGNTYTTIDGSKVRILNKHENNHGIKYLGENGVLYSKCGEVQNPHNLYSIGNSALIKKQNN